MRNSDSNKEREDEVNKESIEGKEISTDQQILEAVQDKQQVGIAEEQPVEGAEGKTGTMSSVYGPVASWRFGRSLGIDLLCSEQKICNFDCIYCQLGSASKFGKERQEFVNLSKLFDDISSVKGVAADWVTFSGMGEPTLASNLGSAISMAKSILDLPVAVLTNGSLINYRTVREELGLADMVVFKLDASDEELFRTINRPAEEIKFKSIMTGWQLFRMSYKGKFAISIMLNEINKSFVHEIQYRAKLLMPDQIQLNTPLRKCSVQPLTPVEIHDRKQWFWNYEVISVYESHTPVVEPIDAKETELRHPTVKSELKLEKERK